MSLLLIVWVPQIKTKKHYPVYAIAVDSLAPPDTGVDYGRQREATGGNGRQQEATGGNGRQNRGPTTEYDVPRGFPPTHPPALRNDI